MPAYSTNIYVYMGVFAAGPDIYFSHAVKTEIVIFRKYNKQECLTTILHMRQA